MLQQTTARLKAERDFEGTVHTVLKDVVALHGAEFGDVQLVVDGSTAAGRPARFRRRGIEPPHSAWCGDRTGRPARARFAAAVRWSSGLARGRRVRPLSRDRRSARLPRGAVHPVDHQPERLHRRGVDEFLLPSRTSRRRSRCRRWVPTLAWAVDLLVKRLGAGELKPRAKAMSDALLSAPAE